MDDSTLMELKQKVDKAEKIMHTLNKIKEHEEKILHFAGKINAIEYDYTKEIVYGWGSDEDKRDEVFKEAINPDVLGISQSDFNVIFKDVILHSLKELKEKFKREYENI